MRLDFESALVADKDVRAVEGRQGVFAVSPSSTAMDLMLISSPSNARSMYMPYYYLYLAGYMEKCGISVTIVDPHLSTVKQNVEYILEQVKLQNPKFIGLACFVTDYDFISDLASKIKDISNAPILVGNAQPSISPEDFLPEVSNFYFTPSSETMYGQEASLSDSKYLDFIVISGILWGGTTICSDTLGKSTRRI